MKAMFNSTLDEATATLVCRYTTPYDPADYAGYHSEFVRLVAAARAHHRRAVLIIDIQDGYPQPNALQRKEIGEAWAAKAADIDAAIAIITASTLIRGVITAIEWILKNSASRRETRAFGRAREAVVWLHELSGVETSRLDAAIDKVRSSSAAVNRAHP